jgi:hypothetical protein
MQAGREILRFAQDDACSGFDCQAQEISRFHEIGVLAIATLGLATIGLDRLAIATLATPIRKDTQVKMEAASNAVASPASRSGGRRDILIEAAPRTDAPATVTIASISDQDWYVSRTHGVYHIPACPKVGTPNPGQGQPAEPLQPYALLLITSRGDALDLGDNRRFPFTITAREIAEDLLQDLHDHGIFVCAAARPTADELSAATVRRDAYYHRLIADGDTLWARGHSFREISDMHRRAAIALGVEREWAYVPTRTGECPACGEKIKLGVAVCKHCHAILDAETAAKHGLGGAPSATVEREETPDAPSRNAAPVREAAREHRK